MISIVAPFYNSEKTVSLFIDRVSSVCTEINQQFEIILIDDRSTDETWDQITKCAVISKNVIGYRLSKNFGQHAAITAGISNANGTLIIIMDCDLQDNPVYIKNLVTKSMEGFDIVCSIKSDKKHSRFRKLTSHLFYTILNSLSDVKLEKNLGTLTLINRKVANEFLKIKDYHRHTSLVFSWLGFKRGFINVEHESRFDGKSSYTFSKLIKHALNGIISQSQKILNASIILGIFMICISFSSILFIFIGSLFLEFNAGWPSLAILILFTTGIILFILGVHGLYIGKIFEQVKDRPIFIIDETTEACIGTIES